MKPRVSIIMPCLNGERHVLASVSSVLAQRMMDFELVFVDNGSTDQTLDIVQAIHDPRLLVLRQPERGVSRARNLGINSARAPLIAFIDSDDTWDVAFLDRMCDALDNAPESVLAYCGWQNLGLPHGRGAPFIPPDYETSEKMERLLVGCRWPIHGCVTRTTVVRQVGGFDTSLVIGEDYLLWMQIAAHGSIVRVPEVLAFYHHHDGIQATRNHVTAVLDTLRAKQIFLARNPEVADALGAARIDELIWGELVRQANALYWGGDVTAARPLYRLALRKGKGSLKDKLRMLAALLPLMVHKLMSRIRS